MPQEQVVNLRELELVFHPAWRRPLLFARGVQERLVVLSNGYIRNIC